MQIKPYPLFPQIRGHMYRKVFATFVPQTKNWNQIQRESSGGNGGRAWRDFVFSYSRKLITTILLSTYPQPIDNRGNCSSHLATIRQ